MAGFYNGDAPSTNGTVLTNTEDIGWENRIGLVEDYSELEYTRIDLTIYTSASLTYSDFDADEDYVYGDESGSSYYGYAGVGYRF